MQTGVSEHVPETAVGEAYTGSSTQFSSSAFNHAPCPFDVRENPFHKCQQGYVFADVAADVCSNGRICASSGAAHIINKQRLQYVGTRVCLYQRGFPLASIAQSHTGRGEGTFALKQSQ